jgi:hypothetical protein
LYAASILVTTGSHIIPPVLEKIMKVFKIHVYCKIIFQIFALYHFYIIENSAAL